MRTGSSVRSDGSFFSVVASALGLLLDQLAVAVVVVFLLVGGLGLLVVGALLLLDHVDAHLVEHRVDVLDLVGRHLLGGQDRVELLVRDVAALLGLLDHLLDRGVAQIEQRQRTIRRLRRGRVLLGGLGGFLVGDLGLVAAAALDAILFSSVFFWTAGALGPADGFTAGAFATEGFGVAGLDWDGFVTAALETGALETDAFEMADLACDLASFGRARPGGPGRAAGGFCLVAV